MNTLFIFAPTLLGKTEARNLVISTRDYQLLLHTPFIAAGGYITLAFIASHITHRTYAPRFICLFVLPYVLLLSHISSPGPVHIRREEAPSVVLARAL